MGMTMDDEPRDDLQGRIESFDQSLRSLNGRLRAVERRLSMDVPLDMDDPFEVTGKEIDRLGQKLVDVMGEVRGLRAEIDDLKSFVNGNIRSDIEKLDENISRIENRSTTAEKEINIGSFRIPMEISGLMGSLILFLTSSLIYLQRWDVIRSPHFSFAIAFLLGISVLGRSYAVNRA